VRSCKTPTGWLVGSCDLARHPPAPELDGTGGLAGSALVGSRCDDEGVVGWACGFVYFGVLRVGLVVVGEAYKASRRAYSTARMRILRLISVYCQDSVELFSRVGAP
jgi:hypothetical protein